MTYFVKRIKDVKRVREEKRRRRKEERGNEEEKEGGKIRRSREKIILFKCFGPRGLYFISKDAQSYKEYKPQRRVYSRMSSLAAKLCFVQKDRQIFFNFLILNFTFWLITHKLLELSIQLFFISN